METRNVASDNWGRWLFGLPALLLAAGLVLTTLSWAQICTNACGEAHRYRLFGFQFETLGLLFFSVTLALHLLSLLKRELLYFAAFIITGGLGAEIWFIYVQKFLIGSWCPICLTIASLVAAVALIYSFSLFRRQRIYNDNHGGKMNVFKMGFPPLALLIAGFTLAFLGTTKINPLLAAQQSLKESIAFGNQESPIEVYLFTDWFCPACRIAEPEIEKSVPSIKKQAKLFFIDAALNPESLNFTPYNLSFMIHNKDQYFPLRNALIELAGRTQTPTDADVKAAIAPLGAELKELNFSDVTLGSKLFKKLASQFGVNATPTLVIINTDTKKGKKLSGTMEINSENIKKAISSLQ